jgi:hypothetical protein
MDFEETRNILAENPVSMNEEDMHPILYWNQRNP